MKTWAAVLLTVGIVLGASFFPPIFLGAIILVTSLWAAVDSGKVELKKYKSGISYGPITLFIVSNLIWVVAFPWYLSVRYKIVNGLAESK